MRERWKDGSCARQKRVSCRKRIWGDRWCRGIEKKTYSNQVLVTTFNVQYPILDGRIQRSQFSKFGLIGVLENVTGDFDQCL